MTHTVNVPVPRNGVVQGATNSQRPETAVHEVENMLLRNTDRNTVQLAVRPGLVQAYQVDFGPEGTPISAVYPIEWANSPEEYSQLAGGSIDVEWAKEGNAVSVVPDLDGGVFFLLANGEVHYRASNGEAVYQFAIPIVLGQTLVSRIRVDALGSVYCATSSGVGGGLSRIYKFVPRADDEGMDLSFRFNLEAETIADFAHYGGQLFVAINSSQRESKVVVLEGAGNDSPVEAYAVSTPYPLQAVEYGTGLIFTCPPDANRGSGGLVGGDSILWTMADLPAADERVHAVYDARYAGDQPDGGRVSILPDVRGLIGVGPLDQTDRSLQAASWWNPSNNTGAPAPTYRVQLDDGDPAIRFDASQGTTYRNGAVEYDNGNWLSTGTSDAPDEPFRIDKPTVSGSLPRSKGLFPHVLTHEFVVAWRIRWPKGSGPQMVWSVGGMPSLGVFPPAETACLALVVQDAGGATVTATSGDGKVTLRGCLSGGYKTLSATEVGGFWEAIVVLHAAGASSTLRVNGTASTAFTLNEDAITSPVEVWGNRIFRENRPRGTALEWDGSQFVSVQAPENEADLWFIGCDSFYGTIRAAWSALAPTTTTPHDTAFPTSEIELIEGALAWRRGEGELLAGGHTYKSTPPLRTTPGIVVQEAETTRALRSPEGIVGRLAAGTDAIQWAEAGAGIGYALAARADGWVYTAGPRLAAPSLPDDVGPKSAIIRRVRDRGALVDIARPLRGEVLLIGQPDVDDEIVIDPGDGNPITFAFDGSGVASSTYVIVAIAGDVEGTGVVLQQELTLSEFYCGERAYLGNDTWSLRFETRQTGGTAAAITVTSPGGHLEVVSGMDGLSQPDGAWEIRADLAGGIAEPGWTMDTDLEGDLYLPIRGPLTGNTVQRINREDGTEVWEQTFGPSGTEINAVAVDQRLIPFGAAIESPEFFYAAATSSQGQMKLRLVSRTPSTRPPQDSATLVIRGGLPFRVDSAGTATALPVIEPFSGNMADLQVAEHKGVVLVSDGTQQWEWNPRLDTWKRWESRRGAAVPTGSRLMAAWNGRIVHADGQDPYQWIMSAMDDYTDYDLTPTIPTAIQATASTVAEGNTSTNDVLTAIIPIGDDLLLFGGLSSIARLTGDPMAGGVLDSVSRKLGIAYGQAWTQMPDGSVVFFSKPAGVWMIDAGGTRLVELSKERIERDLESIDQTKYRVRLAYSRKLRGVMVVPIPLDMDMEFDGRWWLLDDAGAWWPMRWADRTVQPTCVATARDLGDPMFGCFDGGVRTLSGGPTDDGYEFPWFWILGPYWDRQYNKLQRFSRPFARIDSDGPVEWYGYASSGPLEIGLPDASGQFVPGEDRKAGMKLKGKAFWLELRGFGVSAAVEHVTFDMHPAGRTK